MRTSAEAAWPETTTSNDGPIANESASIERVEPFLTLVGLRLIYEKNRVTGTRPGAADRPRRTESTRSTTASSKENLS